jgi:ACS family allantoate permease-like MFS transporter
MESEKVPMDAGSGPKDVGSREVFDHSDADIAAVYADRLDGENAYTAQEEKRLRWKLDLRLVPILWLNVTLSAMDKVTTSTAALYGMKTATNLTGNRYSWVGSAFYVSRLINVTSCIC